MNIINNKKIYINEDISRDDLVICAKDISTNKTHRFKPLGYVVKSKRYNAFNVLSSLLDYEWLNISHKTIYEKLKEKSKKTSDFFLDIDTGKIYIPCNKGMVKTNENLVY